jgi:hypothetical protein
VSSTTAARRRGPHPFAKKQRLSHEDFLAMRGAVATLVPRETFRLIFEDAVTEVLEVTAGRRVGFCWSGGKDSQALAVVMDAAGITDCCFGMTRLEYQAFLVWVTNHMPPGLQVYNNGWDPAWLAQHPEMLFPAHAGVASRWFSGVQHRAQHQFARDAGLELLITGRRKADGNYVPGEDGCYRGDDGVLRYAPLRAWSHADVFACLEYHGITDRPPFYDWPRGYRCGTHAWPARQWCQDTEHGFAEVYAIEPDRVLEAAAAGLQPAIAWLSRYA